jgi:hypothetical protein
LDYPLDFFILQAYPPPHYFIGGFFLGSVFEVAQGNKMCVFERNGEELGARTLSRKRS